MSLFDLLKLVHISCAIFSISGFALRGYWMMSGNSLLQQRPAKVLPHLVDTLLLGSAICMLVIWQVSPLQVDWLMAKIIALLVYIGLGMVALRFGRSRGVRALAGMMALVSAGYIVAVAYTKNPLGYLAL